MKKKILLGMCLLLAVPGCTTRSNRLANQAFERGIQVADSVIWDLKQKSQQLAVNKYTGDARAAALSGNADAAAAAVVGVANEFEEITWLAYDQWAKAQEMLRIARRYVWEQRGWFSVIVEDAKVANARVNAKKDDSASP